MMMMMMMTMTNFFQMTCSNDVRNHQEDARSALNNSKRGAYNSKYLEPYKYGWKCLKN